MRSVPRAAALLLIVSGSLSSIWVLCGINRPNTAGILAESAHLELHTVDPVDAVDEEDEDEDERNLFKSVREKINEQARGGG